MALLVLQFVYFVIMFSRVLVNDTHTPRLAPLLSLDLSQFRTIQPMGRS